MAVGVPPFSRDVEPAAERDRVVDDHQLLMMTGAERERIVHPHVDPLGGGQHQVHGGKRLALAREERREIPQQEPDVEVAPGGDDVLQQWLETCRDPI